MDDEAGSLEQVTPSRCHRVQDALALVVRLARQ